ncbi:MAG: hypothetical protein J7M40_03775 [Planctomycetes bacterium]|nr:hypothetical protein [Planctomycetota bacterium]
MTSIAGAADAGERMIVVPDGDDLCGSCHDDIKVTVPRANETRYERTARWATMSDHAIGMRYAAVAGRRTGQFNYPLIESERIRLFDGKVGCGSCHIK